MKYELHLDINLPRQEVVKLFLDSNNLAKWQPGLVSFEPVSGEPRTLGAKSRQVHEMGSRRVEMLETITKNESPEFFAATYEADKVWNLVENQFIEDGPAKTKWRLTSEFKCGGIMRVMTFLMPGMFKKQTFQFMNHFKNFAERSESALS